MAVDATKIIDARAKAEVVWQDSQAVQSRKYMPKINTLGAILSQQTANFDQLKDRRNCGSVKLTWKALCAGTSTVLTGLTKVNSMLCTPTGSPSNTAVQTFTLDKIIKSSGFTIVDDLCQNVYEMEDLLTDGLLLQHKELVEKLSAYILAQTVSFKGANNFLDNGFATAAGGNLYKISAFDANAAVLVPYLLRVGEAHNMGDPFLLQGSAIYNNVYKDDKQAGTPADSGYSKMWADLNVVEDFKGFNALTMNNDFLMMDAGATALVTKYTGTAAPQTLKADYYLTTMPLLGGTIRDSQGEPLYVDVYHKREMVTIEEHGGVNRCVLGDTFQLELKFGYFLNPLACNAAYTGIIHFQKDMAIAPRGVQATLAPLPPDTMGLYQAIR